MKIREDLLHFIWKTQTPKLKDYKSTTSLPIEVIQIGTHNHFEGPDFKDSIIKIDGQTWVGHTEIHCKSSDWIAHQHQEDSNYNNVILHVVYLHDQDIYLPDGSKLPVIELRHSIDHKQLEVYQSLMSNTLKIPCQQLIENVNPVYLSLQLHQSAILRLQNKTKIWLQSVELNSGDWNTVFYEELMANFGFKSNSIPMRKLAKSLPLKLILKYREEPLQIYSLLFGMAGLLNPNAKDDFEKQLISEFRFLKDKHNLLPLLDLEWKWVKTRPANYPCIRIAQIAEIFIHKEWIFSQCLEMKSNIELINIFRSRAHEYWVNHYHFGKERKKKIDTKIGQNSLFLILINTVAQSLFSYGAYNNLQEYKDKSISLLQSLPAEKNKISQLYHSLGFMLDTAMESQGVLGLKNNFCSKNACLHCQIGQQLIK